MAATAVADRGIRAGPIPCSGAVPRFRPVRRNRGPAVTHLHLAALALLAEDGPHNSGPDFGKASPFGLLVVVLLLISALFLVRSMNRHLQKLQESFHPQHPEPDQAVNDGTIRQQPDDQPPHELGG